MEYKKAQAAMEYLMTYGWAILVIIVVVGVLWRMGVFRAGSTVPCTPCFSYFAYIDHNSTYLLIRNGAREIQSISASGFTVNPTSAKPGEDISLTGNIPSKTEVIIEYTVTDSGIRNSDRATLYLKT